MAARSRRKFLTPENIDGELPPRRRATLVGVSANSRPSIRKGH